MQYLKYTLPAAQRAARPCNIRTCCGPKSRAMQYSYMLRPREPAKPCSCLEWICTCNLHNMFIKLWMCICICTYVTLNLNGPNSNKDYNGMYVSQLCTHPTCCGPMSRNHAILEVHAACGPKSRTTMQYSYMLRPKEPRHAIFVHAAAQRARKTMFVSGDWWHRTSYYDWLRLRSLGRVCPNIMTKHI